MGLSEQQKYLMNRLPSIWDMKKFDDEPESAEVKKARRIIKAFENRQSRRRKKSEEAARRALNNAREAIHFATPAKALAVVKAMEVKFLGKEK